MTDKPRESNRPAEWTEIDDGTGHWFAGIFVIYDLTKEKGYFVATRNVGKRVWDHRDWLRRGRHPCEALQEQFSARPQDFRVFLVERVAALWLLPHLKQAWLDRMPSLNRKRSVPRKPRRRRSPLPVIPSRSDFAPEPSASQHAAVVDRLFKRLARVLPRPRAWKRAWKARKMRSHGRRASSPTSERGKGPWKQRGNSTSSAARTLLTTIGVIPSGQVELQAASSACRSGRNCRRGA